MDVLKYKIFERPLVHAKYWCPGVLAGDLKEKTFLRGEEIDIVNKVCDSCKHRFYRSLSTIAKAELIGNVTFLENVCRNLNYKRRTNG